MAAVVARGVPVAGARGRASSANRRGSSSSTSRAPGRRRSPSSSRPRYSLAYLRTRNPVARRNRRAPPSRSASSSASSRSSPGSLFAKIMWGSWWNWDPRESSYLLLVFLYAAYLFLRAAVDDPERRARIAAAYAALRRRADAVSRLRRAARHGVAPSPDRHQPAGQDPHGHADAGRLLRRARRLFGPLSSGCCRSRPARLARLAPATGPKRPREAWCVGIMRPAETCPRRSVAIAETVISQSLEKLIAVSSLGYLAAVNVVIWVGLFFYLWRLDRRITESERKPMKKGYWIAAVLTLAFLGLRPDGLPEDADALPLLRRGAQVDGRRPGHGRPRQGERPLRHRPRGALASTSSTRAGHRMPVVYRGIRPGQLQGRDLHRRDRALPGRPRSRPRSSSSSAPPSTRERRSRRPTLGAARGSGANVLMYFWPGVAAIWGAPLRGARLGVTSTSGSTAGARSSCRSRGRPTRRSRPASSSRRRS